MGEFPLPRIKHFLQTVVPFDTLAEDELDRVVSLMEISYFPRGEVIIECGGEPSKYLYVIMNGSVSVTLPDESGGEMLVDVRGEGDAFGALSLLQGELALFSVVAREDLLVFKLPAEPFRKLVADNPSFKRHYSFSLARNIKSVRNSADRHLSQMTGSESLGLDDALSSSRVQELMSTEVLTCPPATTIKAAAQMMTQRKVGSMVIVEPHGMPLGIITDTDLRARVLAKGLSGEVQVSQVMSQPMKAISPHAFAFEAMIEMARQGVHHLVVTEAESLVGVLSGHDLSVVTGSSPVEVIKDVAKVASLDDLAQLPKRMDRVMEMLLRLGGSAEYMQEVVTEFNDRLCLRLLEILEKAMEEDGLGPAPAPYSWLALGGAGRREQALQREQEYAVAYAEVPEQDAQAVREWFVELSRRMASGLSSCGLKVREDGVMGDPQLCCRSESQWEEAYVLLIKESTPAQLAQAAEYFDFRAIRAHGDFPDRLWEAIFQAMERNPGFLRHLRGALPSGLPPMGFLRDYVVSRDGEYQEELDLFDSGIWPVVNVARILALDQRLSRTNTLERINAVSRLGLLGERFSDDIYEAYSFITLLRISRYLEAAGNGGGPQAVIHPASLNNVQRKMLKESFRVIRQLQEFMTQRYGN